MQSNHASIDLELLDSVNLTNLVLLLQLLLQPLLHPLEVSDLGPLTKFLLVCLVDRLFELFAEEIIALNVRLDNVELVQGLIYV